MIIWNVSIIYAYVKLTIDGRGTFALELDVCWKVSFTESK